jgi:hypothetical protein
MITSCRSVRVGTCLCVCAHVGLPYECAMAPAAAVHSVASTCRAAYHALFMPCLRLYTCSFSFLPGQSQSAAEVVQIGLCQRW